ncbi:amylo-alpha-1,6-glucosidase [Mycolicibacterium sp. CBMA 226]|uniref:glucosylglycerate hydrolase n=1 Tax=Mycolicibacterium sp. CBMA 226 TaxID=2606611 RepID=UPI0012DC0A44|nr:glycogen debranching protein [Mycolicibacterium sp. CBMA 226]MUL75908.1 glycogen debranching protein [Mycolicibacterium sp. CBMA 226]
MPPDHSFAPTQLSARAAYLLRGNDLGVMTTAAPLLYPHMWSWDAAFVSIGLASLTVERAVVELDTLLSAQWANGMIPHIVFANGVDGYFPGPARWETSALAVNAPRNRDTSGITQPPVHAIAVQRILDHARTRGRSTRVVAEAFLDRRWDDLVRWHRWLAEARDPQERGRVTLYHGWESGMDNSPRWDSAYANVIPGAVPEYQREDNAIITDTSQRPSDVEYDRYLWLLEEMKSVRYDDVLLPKVMSFQVEDVFVSAILSVACTVLAEIGEDYKRPNADVRELYSWAERFRQGVVATADERTGAARDFDLRTGKSIPSETVAQFAPLLCGGLPHDRERTLLRLLEGPRFCAHPDLKYPLIPSTSPVSRDFRPREYWRGPVWPVMTWLFSWCFARRGWSERASILRREGLRQASDGTFAEYYEPFTGEPLGSMQQSWTAAAVLDWLG